MMPRKTVGKVSQSCSAKRRIKPNLFLGRLCRRKNTLRQASLALAPTKEGEARCDGARVISSAKSKGLCRRFVSSDAPEFFNKPVFREISDTVQEYCVLPNASHNSRIRRNKCSSKSNMPFCLSQALYFRSSSQQRRVFRRES